MANKHCKKFAEHDDYIDAMNSNKLSIHTVSYCKNEKDFHYDNDMYLIECIYNVTDTTNTTALLYSSSFVNKMEIDGVKLNNVVSSYKFNTTGHHIVRYSITTLPVLRYLFMYMTELINFKVNKLISRIYFETFYNTGIYSINLPETVTLISNGNNNCFNLERITVDPKNPVYDSRDNCNAIIETATNKLILGCKNTVIPDTVTTIASSAIYIDTTYINGLPIYPSTYVTTINIPNSVTCIESRGLFIPMINLNIPESVISLCKTSGGYEEVNASTNATTVRTANAVFSSLKLLSITVDPNNPVFDSRNNCNALIHTPTNTLMLGCKNTVIPDTVTTIGRYSFYNSLELINITIPASVTYIVIQNGISAFGSCINLETVIFLGETPPTITKTNGGLFSGCNSLNAIYVPNNSVLAYKTEFTGVLTSALMDLVLPMSSMP